MILKVKIGVMHDKKEVMIDYGNIFLFPGIITTARFLNACAT